MFAGLGGMGGMGGMQPPGPDEPVPDTAETIHISSLALLKMLKHGRAGVPMEVMGLMLGSFVDEYTVRVVDVFAMPQNGTGVSVEAVDPVYVFKSLSNKIILSNKQKFTHQTHQTHSNQTLKTHKTGFKQRCLTC